MQLLEVGFRVEIGGINRDMAQPTIRTIQELPGHKDLKTTVIYTHLPIY